MNTGDNDSKFFPCPGLEMFLLMTMTLLFLSPGMCLAEKLVSGKYVDFQGPRLLLEFDVQAPPPSLIIITQSFPPDVIIQQSDPPLKKIDNDQGIAKWLFRDVKPGKHQLIILLSRPLMADEIKGEIQYRDQATGETTKIDITPDLKDNKE